MKNLKPILILLLLFIISSCSITKNQERGKVSPENFNYETEFTTFKTLLILPLELNGVSKNFLFDTGAQYTTIHRDTIVGQSINIDGATNQSVQGGTEIIKSIKIGNVEFINTFAINTNMTELKEKIPNFGGIIGTSIINKANWLIDYPNKKLWISNKNLTDNTYNTVKIKRKGGSPYTYITLNGTEYEVVIDFGSSSELSLPKESKLAKQVLKQYSFEDTERKRYTIGAGLQTLKEKVGILPLVKLGDMEFQNISTKIGVQSQPRIGIGFFTDCIIYIDNLENSYKIKK